MGVSNQGQERLAVDTLRTLAIDAVEQAQSGHPGTPMGAAPIAYALWTRHLRHAPSDPTWPDRDRFVLSAGHASMLLYSLLYLTGYDLSLKELTKFRQLGSRTPGHPEYGMTPGVEATTGPLGQGLANAVGMAIAERRMSEEFNRPDHRVVDHRTYVLCSDGDIQEGISSEAASLAGHLRLGKLVVLYDDNRAQLDGPTSVAFSEDVVGRFRALGWDAQAVDDGTDVAAIDAAIDRARRDPRPSLIAVRTHIGFGSPHKQDTSACHGSPLGPEENRLTKLAYGWDPGRSFHVPDSVLAHYRVARERGDRLLEAWQEALAAYVFSYPVEAAELQRRLRGELPSGWSAGLPKYPIGEMHATRKASADFITTASAVLPELIGGSADLATSTLTDIPGATFFALEQSGRIIRFGVREHAMGAICNGVGYHGGFAPFAGTYLVFSDYMRPAVRLAAISGLHVVYLWTHDSIGVGEDGPTHQAVEQLASLRLIPGLDVYRPGDANETIAAWEAATEQRDRPAALVLCRQTVPVLPSTGELAREGVRRGGYVLLDAEDLRGSTLGPDLVLLATGSELHLAVGARAELAREGIRARVVSMPCLERFAAQPSEYRDTVLPPQARPRISIEAGVSDLWDRWVGEDGAMIAVDTFGLSGKGPDVLQAFGFTTAQVVVVAKGVLAGAVCGPVALAPEGYAPHLNRDRR